MDDGKGEGPGDDRHKRQRSEVRLTMPLNQEDLESFLKQPLVAVIGTVDQAGRPRSAPIWFHWENGAAYMFTGRRTLKWRNLQAVPHASLCVDKREPPYTSVIMDGTVQAVDRSLYDLVLSMALRLLRRGKRTRLRGGLP